MGANMNKIFVSLAFISSLFFLNACGPEAGLYEQEKIMFENGNDQELDLSEEEKSDFAYHGWFGAPMAPWPIFEYYKHPLPVLVPVNPLTNIIEWVHPMYADLYLSGNFGPRDRRDRHDL